jgi:hypothetical protein
MNINRMFALGNNNKQHSLYANRNYDEIKQRESVEKQNTKYTTCCPIHHKQND